MASVVALTLLEVIQDQDRPEEILQDEDPAITMPRRLGLSDVVLTQVRRYREEARKGQRITEAELGDLLRLVARRPDAGAVFTEAGRRLSHKGRGKARKARLKGRIGRAVARRRVRKRLKALFGRKLGSFGQGSFVLEGAGLPFVVYVPEGHACALLSGLCEGVLGGEEPGSIPVHHTACQGRADEICRWTAGEGAGGEAPEKEEGADVASPA